MIESSGRCMITTIDDLAKATNPRPWMVMGGNGHETVTDAEGVVFATLYLFSAVEMRAFDEVILGSGYALEMVRDLEKRLDAALKERNLYRDALGCRLCDGSGDTGFGICPRCIEARELAREKKRRREREGNG